MAHVPPALPNFEVIARSHADLSRELALCENLPTLREGNIILQEIRAMRDEMRHMRAEVGQLKTLVTASNGNTIARLHNSQIITLDQHLMPLRSTLTDGPIPFFPDTVNDLQRLPHAVTTDILRALGASVDGNAATRKLRLRLQCGLKQEPI